MTITLASAHFLRQNAPGVIPHFHNNAWDFMINVRCFVERVDVNRDGTHGLVSVQITEHCSQFVKGRRYALPSAAVVPLSAASGVSRSVRGVASPYAVLSPDGRGFLGAAVDYRGSVYRIAAYGLVETYLYPVGFAVMTYAYGDNRVRVPADQYRVLSEADMLATEVTR